MRNQAQSLSIRVERIRLDPTRLPDSHPSKRRSMELARKQQEEDRRTAHPGDAGYVASYG